MSDVRNWKSRNAGSLEVSESEECIPHIPDGRVWNKMNSYNYDRNLHAVGLGEFVLELEEVVGEGGAECLGSLIG